MQRHYLIALLVLIFNGCAYGPYGPRTLQDIFHQTNEKEAASYKPVEMPMPKIEFSKKSTPDGGIVNIPIVEKKTKKMDYSLKQLYFLTLLYQYNALQKISKTPPSTLAHCPRFHNIFLEHRLKARDYYANLDFSNMNNASHKLTSIGPEYFPETFLPGEQDGLVVHTKKIRSQLEEICDTGISYEYYIFENLASQTRNAQNSPNFTPSNESMHKLLKNLILFNHFLELSLTDGQLPQEDFYTELFSHYLKLGKIEWAKEFYNEFAQKRRTD